MAAFKSSSDFPSSERCRRFSLIEPLIAAVSTESLSSSSREDSIFYISGKAVMCFSPLRASVKGLRRPRTSLNVSKVVMSLSLGIRCHFFRSSASTAHSACCCSKKSFDQVNEFQWVRVRHVWINVLGVRALSVGEMA